MYIQLQIYNLSNREQTIDIAFENYRDCNAFRLSPDMENNHYKVEGFKYDANILLGDINGDDSVTIQDATLIQKYLIQIVDFSDEQLSVADTDSYEKVNIRDATLIQKYLANIVTSLG